jgi:hypothetical protein
MSRVNQKYILTILTPTEGNYVRMMKESNMVNPADQSGFEVNGVKTFLDNNGVLICNNGLSTDVISCLRNSNKKTVFNVIRTGNEVTFKTDNNRCLSIDDYDDALDAFFLRLNECREGDLRQRFILGSFSNKPPAPNPNVVNDITPPAPNPNEIKVITPPAPNPNEIKGITPPAPNPNEIKGITPPAPTPNVINDVTPPAPNPNEIKVITPPAPLPNVIDSNAQNNNPNACSNVALFNNGFTPVTCNSNNIPMTTDGTQFGGYINPFCVDSNLSSSPNSFIGAYEFIGPVQPNDCNNHQIWTSTFRRSY